MPFLLLFFLLLALGLSVYLVMGVVAALLFMWEGHSLGGFAQVIVDNLNSNTLMAVPFFVIAATFMERGGMARMLIDAASSMIGRLHGGTALVCVMAATIFAAISGSSLATAMAMGTILIPTMIAKKYDRSFALGVVGASGTLGILIPPSLALIVYGMVAEVSVPKLFLAGVIPGLLQATLFAAWIYFFSRRKNYPVGQAFSFSNFVNTNVKALPTLTIPLIVLGGIYSGMITVTEAAILSAILAIFLSVAIYRNILVHEVIPILSHAIKNSARLIMIVAFALALGHWISASRITHELVLAVVEMNLSAWQFLLAMSLVMLFLGMFLEVISVMLITLPLVLPLLHLFGISPIHYAIIVTINMELALLTPPVGLNLFVLSSISKAPIEEVIKGVYPFIILLVLLLLLITFVPVLSTWLPGVIYPSQ